MAANKTEEALARAEKRAELNKRRAQSAEQALAEQKKSKRQERQEAMAENKHIFVRLTTDFVEGVAEVGGQFVGARYLGPGRRIINKLPLTWGGLGMIVGTVGKMATVSVEDTWAEPAIAAPAQFLKNLFAVDVVNKGLELRAKAQAEKK